MIEKRLYEPLLKYAALVFCVVWIVYMMLHNEVPVDVGDGIMHFFISQASWDDPNLFLHHWGKPFFILVSSPFSQFGFNGLVVFNILVFCVTILIGYRILKKKGVSIWLQVLFPLILLKAHDVANTLLGGLTEPLFNLAAIASLYFLLEKKYFWFAVIVSFMPFMRSEGQLPLLLAFIVLIYNRSYRAIPFLFFGFVLYAFVGIFVYSDFWWYFTESPYSMNNDIYGKGTWMHYVLSYKNYLGNPGLYILILGIPAMFVLAFQRKWKELELEWWFYAYGIFMGVLVSHSYFWATGQNGSFGLTRIATQGVPIFLLLHLYYISRFKIFNHWIANSLFGCFSIGLIYALVTTKYYPKNADPLDKQLINAAEYLRSNDLNGAKIYYHFPLFCYAYGENSLKKDGVTIFHTFSDLKKELKERLKPGDLIVRDSHFGPVEMNLPLSEIAKYPELVKIKEFISSEQKDDQYGETEGVIIYQYIPFEKQQNHISDKKQIFKGHLLKIKKDQEFTDIHTLLPVFEKDTKVSLTLTAKNLGYVLAYDFNNAEEYSKMDLRTDQSVSNAYLFRKNSPTKLYIWNPKKVEGEIVIESLEIEQIDFQPLMNNQR
jgi:hypothetical protein